MHDRTSFRLSFPSLKRQATQLLVTVLVLSASRVVAGQSRHALPLQFGSPVSGAPFSAVRVLDYEPAEGSSDPVRIHGEEKYWRDSEGRTRSEIRYDGQMARVYIVDLVSRMEYSWAAGDTVVHTFAIPPAKTPTSTRPMPTDLPDDAPQIEGVKTRYNRSVRGSEEASEVVESWYSPELRVALLTIIDKKGEGKTTYRFTHVVRGEPDPGLFKVPSGFTMEDAKKQPPPPVERATTESGGQTPTPATSGPQPAYLSDPKFEKALADAKQRGIAADERLARWKKANKIANGQCVECLHQVLLGQIDEKAWKDAINSSNQLEALTDQKKERYFAYAERGDAYMHLNDGKPNAQQLALADTAFGQALQIAPQSTQMLFAEGTVLAKQGRDDEAKAMFKRYLDVASAGDHYRTRVEHFVDNPHLASQPMAPPFRLVTAQGDELELDDMGGKVVLLDFWATWCGPCKETTPEIAHLAKEFAGQPLVVISISTDRDDIAWKTYIEKNHMDWPQYRDANGSLSSAYAVSAIPRFFTIDTDGVLQSIKVGSNADVEGDIRRLLSKARKAEKRKAETAERLSPPATPPESQVAQNPVSQ